MSERHVLTAAHCFDDGSPVTSVKVAQNGPFLPYGVAKSIKVRVSPDYGLSNAAPATWGDVSGWFGSLDDESDYALITLDRPVGLGAGHATMKDVGPAYRGRATISGYPVDLINNNYYNILGLMYQYVDDIGHVTSVDDEEVDYTTYEYTGQSGAGVFGDSPVEVYAVNHGVFWDWGSWSAFGARLTSARIRKIQGWIDEDRRDPALNPQPVMYSAGTRFTRYPITLVTGQLVERGWSLIQTVHALWTDRSAHQIHHYHTDVATAVPFPLGEPKSTPAVPGGPPFAGGIAAAIVDIPAFLFNLRRLAVFAVGNGTLYGNMFVQESGTWDGWKSWPQPLDSRGAETRAVGTPVAITAPGPSGGTVPAIFARAQDGSACVTGLDGTWENIGGYSVFPVAAIYVQDVLFVCETRPDGLIWYKYRADGAWYPSQQGWENFANPLPDDQGWNAGVMGHAELRSVLPRRVELFAVESTYALPYVLSLIISRDSRNSVSIVPVSSGWVRLGAQPTAGVWETRAVSGSGLTGQAFAPLVAIPVKTNVSAYYDIFAIDENHAVYRVTWDVGRTAPPVTWTRYGGIRRLDLSGAHIGGCRIVLMGRDPNEAVTYVLDTTPVGPGESCF